MKCFLNRYSLFISLLQDMQLQVFYSIMDQLFHNQESPVTDTVTILKEVQNKYYGLPYVPGTVSTLGKGVS